MVRFLELLEEFLAKRGAFVSCPLALLDDETIFYGQGLARCYLGLEVGSEATVVALAVEGWLWVRGVIEIKSEIAFAANDHALSLPEQVLHVLVAGPVLGFAFSVLTVFRSNVIGLLACL